MKTQNLPDRDLYDRDYALWLEITVEKLKQGHFDDVDWENVIEEIEGMGRSERQAIESLLTRLLEHLLKLAYWESERERNANHWIIEITGFRSQLKKRLQSTTLKNYAVEIFEECYREARENLTELGIIDRSLIPETPNCSL